MDGVGRGVPRQGRGGRAAPQQRLPGLQSEHQDRGGPSVGRGRGRGARGGGGGDAGCGLAGLRREAPAVLATRQASSGPPQVDALISTAVTTSQAMVRAWL